MRYISNKWLYMLLMAASVALVGCKQEDLNSNGSTEQRDPNLVSVSFGMAAGVQESISENGDTQPQGEKQKARALGYRLEDVQKGEKMSYSVLKFDTASAPKILEAYGIFYCPTAPKDSMVYISNGLMQWTKKTSKDNRVRYEIHKGGVVDIPRKFLNGKDHQWYFAGLLGADYDPATKTLSFDPYKDATANGLKYQFNNEVINLNLPLTTDWVKLHIYAPQASNPDPWFYPDGYEATKGQPTKILPSVTFHPRGTVFRLRVKNESINDLRIMSYSMESNAVAFKTTISVDDVIGQEDKAISGGKLQMTPVMNHPTQLLVFDRGNVPGRIVPSNHESQSGVTLAWGYLNEAKQKELAPNIGKKGADTIKSPEVPYIAVRASANPSGDDKWNSMEKAADYYPIENRVSYISQAPIYYTYVTQTDTHFKDGGSEWLRVKVTTTLTNLERTTFEVLNENFTPGNSGAFKRGHPWMNRHSDGGNYWLDGVAYPNLAQLKTWMASTQPFKGEAKADPDLVDHKGNPLVNLVSTAKYYLPHAEEIQSYLPIEDGKSDSLYIANGLKKGPFTVTVIEQNLNIKHGARAGDTAKARFILKGGDSNAVNASNYGKNLQTGAPISLINNANSTPEQMKDYNYFNYFWCSHIVYGLAYLRKDDPESLVAYRYFWGISPENAGVPLANSYPSSNQWFVAAETEKMNAIYGPENVPILKEGTKNPSLGETLRHLSAWTGGRMKAGGVGKSMVSFFSVGMRYIGKYDPQVRSLGDINVVSNEKWWTSDVKNVVFRIFSAVGFANGKSLNNGKNNDINNRNRGVYILTQTNDDGAGNHDYFYIGPKSWGRFNTKDEPALSKMWLKMHENGGINYKPGGQTPKYSNSASIYNGAPGQYYISRAYLPANSGAPTHFMVGIDPKTK